MGTGGAGGQSGVFRFRRDGGDKPYMFKVNNEVIIGSFGDKGHNDNQNRNLAAHGDNLQCNGGTGPFAKWQVHLEGDGKVRIQSKKTNKYLRIQKDGSVDVAGGTGPWTLFKADLSMGVVNGAMKVRLQSVQTGKYLHVGVEQKEFTKHYMFAKDNTVILKHVGGQNLRVDPKNTEMAHHEGGLGEFALWTAEPESNGSECRFKSQKTGKYLRIGPQGNLNVGGGKGPWTLFKVHKQGGGKVKLEGKKSGKYPAFRDGIMKTGTGGEFTVFEVFRKN